MLCMYYIHMTYSSASAIVLFYFLLLLLLFVPLLFNSSITRWHCLHSLHHTVQSPFLLSHFALHVQEYPV